MRGRTLIRRLGRIAAIAAGGLVGLVLLVVLLLLLGPVRDGILGHVVGIADDALPGTLAIDEATWPAPGRLELRGVRWTLEERTLAAAGEISADVDLGALWQKDVHVRDLVARAVEADVPAITGAFGPSEETPAHGADPGPPPFPREGALPWIPSIGVDSLRVEIVRLVAADSLTLQADLALGIDLRAGRSPVVDLRGLDAAWTERAWTVRSDGLVADLATGVLDGRVAVDLGAGRSFDLSLESDARREFRLALAERGQDPGRDDPGLLVTGSFSRRENGAIDSLLFDANLRTPDPERIETLLERPGLLEAVAELGIVTLHARGDVVLADPVLTRTELAAAATGWPGTIEGPVHTTGRVVETGGLRVQAEGLEFSLRGRFEDGAWDGAVQARVAGVNFVDPFLDPQAYPSDLRARLDLEASGRGTAVAPRLRLTGAAPSAGLDSLLVEAEGDLDGTRTDLRIDLRALARQQLAVALDARVQDLENPRVHLAPLRLATALDRLGDADPPDQPTLRLQTEPRAIEVDGLRITGAAGEWRLDARAADSGPGRGRLSVTWPTPPELLGLAGFDAATRDTLLAPTWTDGGTPGLDLEFELPDGLRSGTATARLELPAPWQFVAGLPAESYTAPNLLGQIDAHWNEDVSWRADLDFASTAWLDSAFVHLGGADGTARLDSLLLRGGPARITAAARVDSTTIDGKLQLDLVSTPQLRQIAPQIPDDLDFLVNLRAGVDGARDAPDARAQVLASLRSPTLEIPLVKVEAEALAGILQFATVEIPEEARVGQFGIERARIEAIPDHPSQGLIPLSVASEIQGDAVWRQTAWVDSSGGTWTVRSDSLALGARGHVLQSRAPFSFSFAPADSILQLEGLDLQGPPGSVLASFDLRPRQARADVEIHLDATLPSMLVNMPPQMMPTGYHADFEGDQDDMQASVWIEGVDLGARKGVVVRFDAHRTGDRVQVDLHAADELGVLADGRIALPLDIDLLERRAAWQDGPVEGTVVVDSLPLPWKIGEDKGLGGYLLGSHDASTPLVDARFAAGGTGRQPAGAARVIMTFPGIEELQEESVELDALWVGRSGDPAALQLFEDAARLRQLTDDVPGGGIAVRGAVVRSGTAVATLQASLPLAPDSSAPLPGFGPEDPVKFALKATPLRLDEWDALVPRGTEISGELDLEASGEGPIGDLPLEIALALRKVRYQESFGSTATLDGTIDVGGRSTAPDVKGRIRVASALVRLPDKSRDLLPVEGDSRLWQLDMRPVDRFAALDSLQVEWGWRFSAPDTTDAEAESGLTLAESTKLDVTVEFPNSFWIRGQGLEVQLAGELHLELVEGLPRVVGELRAIGGSIDVVGARLRLSSGTVTFYGGDTKDPTLDLQLSRTEGDVRVIVLVTGTASEPKLEFDSDPPMSQTDIMSYLLFGHAAGELDGAQTQLLQDQAAAALSQFASPVLENELTQSLGISMVQLQAGEDPDEGLSLVVGKYVTPQILVKYEQSLREREKYTVNAEYWLNQNFRVETQLSESRSTGIMLNWSNDY